MTAAELSALLPAMLPRLWRFALRISGNRHDAEDLVQCACVRALERAHQLAPGTAPLSWLFSIVQSTWLNELRARNVRNGAGPEWDDRLMETIADPAAKSPEQHAMNGQIIRAVHRLPDAQRVVLLLVAVEGLSYSEAADVLQVPIGTVMSRLSRARQAIGSQFTEPEDEPRATGGADREKIGT
ncbi:RNA polymerase sigma factor [Paraburkholderia sp. MMS20-SJTN17]|uniref:RNA polymerase sigma factor n=1 Tax=Paraburkholderia translucens TaxID=2886945 RepID=A0ABS8KCS6_9BURK|nr:RNA polymerase sigma factor [Paraburkholderia sp. MMS20-SJTN17]MCC8402467.1 RNA polymerase sigma factor [Paraburkholderia sp. MMS20-SJTN17]